MIAVISIRIGRAEVSAGRTRGDVSGGGSLTPHYKRGGWHGTSVQFGILTH
jgi:hypothetical protein